MIPTISYRPSPQQPTESIARSYTNRWDSIAVRALPGARHRRSDAGTGPVVGLRGPNAPERSGRYLVQPRGHRSERSARVADTASVSESAATSPCVAGQAGYPNAVTTQRTMSEPAEGPTFRRPA